MSENNPEIDSSIDVKRTPIDATESTNDFKLVKASLDQRAERLATYLEEITARYRVKVKTEDPTLKVQVARVESAIRDYGINNEVRQALAMCFGALLDTRVATGGDRDRYRIEVGVVLVPIRADNNHAYPLNQPVIVYDGGTSAASCVQRSGNTGNSLPLDINTVRYATKDEVFNFARRCNLDKVCKQLRILLV